MSIRQGCNMRRGFDNGAGRPGGYVVQGMQSGEI